MSVPSRFRNIFTSKKSQEFSSGGASPSGPGNGSGFLSGSGGGSSKLYLNENISKGLILICIELCKRKQAARVLNEIKSKEAEKICSAIQNGNVTSKQLNDIINTDILWTSLISTLDSCQPMIERSMTAQILQNSKVESIALAITNLSSHHKKLMGALIPTAEALGEGNHLLAEQMLREIGSRIIEPASSDDLNDRSSIETSFVRLAVNTKYLFPYTRQFYMDAGTLEIPDSAAFWDLIADHQDEGVLARSHGSSNAPHLLTRSASSMVPKKASVEQVVKLERTMSVPLKKNSFASDEEKDDLLPRSRSPQTLFDKQRHELNQRLNAEGEDDKDIARFSDEDDAKDSRRTRNRRGFPGSPVTPPPNVPLPSGPKPSLHGSSDHERRMKKPIFLVPDREDKAPQADPQAAASMDDLRELFEKCCVGRVADLSLFIRELRAAFGNSSSELRNQLIEQTSSGSNSQKISWKQFTDVMNSPQLRGEKLIFLPNYQRPSDDIDDIPMAASHYREPNKESGFDLPGARTGGHAGTRTTPVETFFEDSELDSPAGLQRGRVSRSGELPSSGELKSGKRGRRGSPARESLGNPLVEPFNSWDSDSTGSVSPVKPLAGKKHNDPPARSRNAQSKLSLDVLDKEPTVPSDAPVFLQPFHQAPKSSSPELKRSALNTTPANVTDDILDFSGGESSPNLKPRKAQQFAVTRRVELKSEGKSVVKRREPPDDTIQSFHTDSSGLSLETSHLHHNHNHPSHSPLSTPGKKGGRREGEARRRFADLNASGEDLDISWDDLIPTLEDDSKKRNPKLIHPPLAKQSADHKLLSFAVSNSAKRSKSPSASHHASSDDPPGLRNHFRRENSEASALGGLSPVYDLDMSVMPLDMLPDTCLSMDEVLSPVSQTESPPKPEVATRRKPKPSGMFSLTAVDVSQSSVDEASIPDLGSLPGPSSSHNDPSPPGSNRSAFNQLTTPKSSRANSIFSNPERLKEEKIDDDVAKEGAHQATLPEDKPVPAEDHTLASLEMVSKALSSLSKEHDSDSQSPLPVETNDRLSQDSSQEPKKSSSSSSSMKKKITGVFNSATKFLQNSSLSRSNSRDHSDDHDQPQAASTSAGGSRPLVTRSRANSDLSLGNASVGTHRASLTDRDDDDSIELPIGIAKMSSSSTQLGVVDAPVSTIDVSALKTSTQTAENSSGRADSEHGAGGGGGGSSKGFSSGIFSKTKSLTRSSSWGLKSFLGIKSAEDSAAGAVPPAIPPPPDQQPTTTTRSSVSASADDDDVSSLGDGHHQQQQQQQQESLSLRSQPNSRPSSRNDDRPPLSHGPPSFARRPSSQRLGGDGDDGDDEDHEASSVRSHRSAERKAAVVSLPSQSEQDASHPRTRSPSPVIQKSGPVIQLPSARNTPKKKRDWDLDNSQDEEEALISNLLGKSLFDKRDGDEYDHGGGERDRVTPPVVEKEIPMRSIIPPRDSPSPALPAAVNQPRELSPQDWGVTPPLPREPSDEVSSQREQSGKRSEKPALVRSQSSDRSMRSISDSSDHPTPPLAPLPPPPPPISIPQIKRTESDASESNSTARQAPLVPDRVAPHKTPVTDGAPRPTTSAASASAIPWATNRAGVPREMREPPQIQRVLQLIPENYLALYQPQQLPHSSSPPYPSHSESAVAGEAGDVHEGLYQALLYRQQVHQRYSTASSPPQPQPTRRSGSGNTGDRNVLGKKLNERYLQLRQQRHPSEQPPQDSSDAGDESQSQQFSVETKPGEDYPEFILEAFPHLRSEVSPLQRSSRPKPSPPSLSDPSLSGRDVILALYDREQSQQNALQRRREPLPAHLPLHSGEEEILAVLVTPPSPRGLGKRNTGADPRLLFQESHSHQGKGRAGRKIDVMKSVKARKSLVF